MLTHLSVQRHHWGLIGFLVGMAAIIGCDGCRDSPSDGEVDAGDGRADAEAPSDGGGGATDARTAADGGGTDGSAAIDGGGAFPPLPEPLAALPPHQAAEHDRFQTRDSCNTCHATDGTALVDASGRDVSPSNLWRSSMMAFAGRDPYFLAAFSHEIESHPAATEVIEATCTRCHAPAANEALRPLGDHPTFDELTAAVEPVDHLGRDGVTCTACHQLDPENLGLPESFSGGWVVGDSRRIYGPHAAPFENNMRTSTGYTPVHSSHMRESRQCASCHTLFTNALDGGGTPVGPDFPEQTPYLEWQNSDYRNEDGDIGPRAATCQSCHVPTLDEDGAPIVTPISTRPGWLEPRTPIGRHVFVGANAYMLELIADQRAWIGTPVPESEIRGRAALTRANLRTAADVSLATRVEGDELVVDVTVVNRTGHKLPTGYPSRRAWLHIELLDGAGEVLWASGRTDANGALVDEEGRRLDPVSHLLPHRDAIAAQDQVQVYESVMADAAGAPTSILLSATAYLKDDRILPYGWEPDHAAAEWTAPAGTDGDDDFVPGSDRVTYRLPRAGGVRVRARLLYQSVPPAAVEGLRDHPTPATARLVDMTGARAPVPQVLAEVEAAL